MSIHRSTKNSSGHDPSVDIQAALHAHELPGTAAFDRLTPRLDKAENEGRLSGNDTLVPHANPTGLAQGVYGETHGRIDLSGRVNFDQSFQTKMTNQLPGKPAAERLNATLVEIAVNAEVIFDLYCVEEGPVIFTFQNANLTKGAALRTRCRPVLV